MKLNQMTQLRCALLAASIIFSTTSHAAKFKSAEVTRVVNDVKILTGTKTSRAASKGAVISGSTALRTGQKSRAELQFPDESIVRLGSNSVFSFLEGRREVELEKGTLLMQVPKSLGRTKVKTAAISAAITGTTILIEFIPDVLDADGNIIKYGTVKIIVVEGSLEFALNSAPRKTLKLVAGEMIALRTDAKTLPVKFKIDLEHLVRTSLLMNAGLGPLVDVRPVDREIAEQKDGKRRGFLVARSDRRQPRGRIFSRTKPGDNAISRARVVVNGRPLSQPATPPANTGGPANNNNGNPNPVTSPGTDGVTLPDRPGRTPPGTPPR